MAEIVQLLVSPGHRYEGRPAPIRPTRDDLVERVEVRAGLGLVGDRYFNRPAHRDAAVTVMSAEALDPWDADLVAARRNVLLRGVDVDAGRGHVLSLDSGDGPVLLRLVRAAHPCAWLDHTVGAGAWQALRGHGGMRCVPLTDGTLRVGPVAARWLTAQETEFLDESLDGGSQRVGVRTGAQDLAGDAGQHVRQ